jgi:hypothetical protein
MVAEDPNSGRLKRYRYTDLFSDLNHVLLLMPFMLIKKLIT